MRAQLDTLMSGRTTFVIAQRLSTVRRADLILLMDDGRLVDVGHARGAARHSDCLYAEIAASQLIGGGDEPEAGVPRDRGR